MLDRLRKGASGWVAQLLIALLVVSFAVWGVSDIFSGFRSDAVATVGATDVPTQDFAREYDMATRQLSAQLRQPVSPQQAQLFGLPGQVLGRLVAEATLNDEAATLGLGISSATLAQQIADDPSFRGPSGAFDRGTFATVLMTNGLTEDQYIERLRETYIRQQLVDALAGAPRVPDVYLKALHEFRAEQRDLAYLVLMPALIPPVAEPTDAELTAYFDANKATWRAPEFRAVKIVRMTPEDLADTGTIDDAEVRKLYDSVVATRFTTPEQRKVDQVIFKDAADASQAAAALSSGKTFDELLADRQLKPSDVDLGLVTRDKLLDPKIAEAAFSLAANSVSGIIEGRFGPVMIRVTEIRPEVVTPYEAARPALEKELAEKRAAAEIADQHDVIEDAQAGGDTLDEVAARYGLKVVTVAAVDSSGKDSDGNAIADLPGGSALVSAVFDSDVGLQNNPIRLTPDGYAWFAVTSVSAARDRELSEVREKVVAAWKKDQVDKQLAAKAEELRARLAAGEDIAKVAGEAGLTVQTASKVTRTTTASGDLSSAVIQQAFSGPKGHAAVAAGSADQSKVVLVVTDVVLPAYDGASADIAQVKQQLSTQMTTDLMQQYVAQLQDRLGVRINQTTLQAVLGTTPGT